MAKPNAELILDADYGPSLIDGADGLIGTRHYRVNTHDEYEAITAAGLPAKDDIWSPTIPGLTARQIGPAEYIGGTNDASTGIGGWHRVRVEYSNYIEVRPLPRVGRSYTEIQTRVSSITILRDVRPDPPANAAVPIENGKGAQREIGGTIARITTFPGQYNADNILASIALQFRQGVNVDAITLPPILKSGLVLALGPRQARYHDFDIGMEAGLLKIVHILILAPDHDWHWWTLGIEGQQLAQVDNWLYESASFAGLW